MKKLKSRLLRLLLIGLFIVAAVSCEVTITGLTRIRIVNPSSNDFTITVVNIVTADSGGGWGSNLLSPNVIVPGESAYISVYEDFYDVNVIDTGAWYATAADVYVGSGFTTALYYDDNSHSLSY